MKKVYEGRTWKEVVTEDEFAKLWVEKFKEHEKNCMVEDCDLCHAFRNFKNMYKIKK